MKNIAIYARVSTEEQVKFGKSVQTQVDELRNYAKQKGYKIVGEYIDEGISGGTLKRPALQRLLEDIKKGQIKLIVFVRFDRWTRDVEQYYKIQPILREYGVEWESVHEEYETKTSTGKLTVNVMLSVNQQFKDVTSERIRSVFDYQIKNGFYVSGALPKGFRLEKVQGGSKVVKDEEYEPFVEDFLTHLETNQSLRSAQKYVNAKYGTSFTRQVFQSILNNPLFCGEYRGVKNFCEGYRTKEQMENLREIVKTKNIRRNTNRTYLFSGLVVCAECGKKYSGHAYNHIEKTIKRSYKSYRCGSHFVNSKCNNSKAILEKTLEKYLLDNVMSELETYIAKIEIKDKIQKKVKSKADRTELQGELNRLNKIFQKGNISEVDYDKEYEEISLKLQELDKEEKPINVEPLKKVLEMNLKEVYNDLTEEEKRIFWRSFVEKITVDNERNIRIYFLS